MQVHTSLPDFRILEKCALSIGTFDGVHRGHQRLIEVLKREANTRDLPSAVLTFQDMPYCFFRPDDCPRLLTLPHEKIAAFEKMGIDYLFIVLFNKQVAMQSYDSFAADILSARLGLKLLVAGPDFARTHVLSLSPMKTVIRDYALICESYYEALRGSSPSQIESVDMGRRGLHNEGAELLKARLEGKVEMDKETARRLFTLVCAVYRRG